MVFFRKILLFALLFFVGCNIPVQKSVTPATLQTYSPQCHAELVQKIRLLTDLKNLTLSKDIFLKDDLLMLSNHPQLPYPHEDRLIGVRGSQKLLKLFQEDGKCYVALLNYQKQIQKKIYISQCICKKSMR